MHGMLKGLELLAGTSLLALGLIVLSLPVVTGASLSAIWVFSGTVSFLSGAAMLWFVRRPAKSPAAVGSRNDVAFFGVVGLFNLLILVLTPHEPRWQPAIVVVGAIVAASLVVRIVRAVRSAG